MKSNNQLIILKYMRSDYEDAGLDHFWIVVLIPTFFPLLLSICESAMAKALCKIQQKLHNLNQIYKFPVKKKKNQTKKKTAHKNWSWS